MNYTDNRLLGPQPKEIIMKIAMILLAAIASFAAVASDFFPQEPAPKEFHEITALLN